MFNGGRNISEGRFATFVNAEIKNQETVTQKYPGYTF